METKANFALIGALLVLSVVAFAAFTLWLGQSQFSRDFDTYEVVFDGPVTLETGADVRFNGISVGEVTRVAIDRENDKLVRARIRVNSETPVRTDSFAEIDLAGITGLTFVQIQAGSQDAPLLESRAGEPIPVIRSELNALAQIFAGGAQVLETANEGLVNISELLSVENVGAFSNTLANLDALTNNLSSDIDLSREISTTLASVRRASDDFGEASRTFTELGQSANTEIKALRSDVSVLVSDLRQTISGIDQLTGTATSTLEDASSVISPAIGAVEEYRLAGQDLRILIDRLDSLAKELEQNPQSIVTGTPKPFEKQGRRR